MTVLATMLVIHYLFWFHHRSHKHLLFNKIHPPVLSEKKQIQTRPNYLFAINALALCNSLW